MGGPGSHDWAPPQGRLGNGPLASTLGSETPGEGSVSWEGRSHSSRGCTASTPASPTARPRAARLTGPAVHTSPRSAQTQGSRWEDGSTVEYPYGV